MELAVYHQLPEGLIDRMAHELHQVLPGPTLIHVQGEREPALFLSVLQHGNETTGWEALREWLAQRNGHPLPRSLLLFIANPIGARDHRRIADGFPDFNRCWPGTDLPDNPVQELLADVTERARRAGLFASVDIHNNSGRNPHYGAMTRLRPQWLALARRFARQAVFFEQPPGVQCDAFSEFCPAITVECGLAGLTEGIPHCRSYIDDLMGLASVPEELDGDLDLFHTVARVTVQPELSFTFGRSGKAPVHFRIDLDALNFMDLPPGTPLAEGSLGRLDDMLMARDWHGQDVLADYFEISDGALRTRRPMSLSMLSRRPEIVRQDCFCYIMERYPTPRFRATPDREDDRSGRSGPASQPSILNETRNVPF